MSHIFIFNQYYIDLIKRLKTETKKTKDTDELCNTIYTAIKENYLTLDKSSDEYVNYVNSNIKDTFWTTYIDLDDIENTNEWFENDDIHNTKIFENISLGNVREILKDDFLCHHFLSVFYIFKGEISNDEIKTIVIVLQGTDKDISIDNINNDKHKKILQRLNEMRNKRIKDKCGIDMKGLEDTTLGKLAKEILEDVDIEKIKNSIGESGDVLKAIGNPDSGFSELISNVSRKMANKISSGELKQETLLQDAFKFASCMPGMFDSSGNKGNSSTNQGPDMSAMMNMMSSMMGNKNGMNMFKDFAQAANVKHPKGSKPSFNNSALKKMAASKKLKAKLDKKREREEK